MSGIRPPSFDSLLECVQVGDTVSITGTVKKHDQFKDEKQTVITRAKYTRAEVSA